MRDIGPEEARIRAQTRVGLSGLREPEWTLVRTADEPPMHREHCECKSCRDEFPLPKRERFDCNRCGVNVAYHSAACIAAQIEARTEDGQEKP
jgi:hypothetical protein